MKNGFLIRAGFWTAPALVCVAAITFAAPLPGQTAEFNGRPIREIRYSPPDVLAPADLKDVTVLKAGVPYSSDAVPEAIDSLFATGLFNDISVEVESSGDGVAVRFVTEPAKFISG